MASKEATVYIVDCGSTMGEKGHGRKQTNLEWALEYVWDRITATVATGRKTALAGVVGLRTDGTENSLRDDEDYAHVTVFQELSQILMPQIRKLRNDLVVSSTDVGDALSALVIAIQMIVVHCKKLQYERKIVLVTDGRGIMKIDGLSDIVAKIKEDNIKLVVIGVDFDDAEYGFKEEAKDGIKAGNESMLKQLCEDCNGEFGTLAQAVDELSIPRIKSVKPVPSYKGFLTLGNPELYDSAISINIERYPKTMKASPPSASQFVLRSDMTGTHSTATLHGDGRPKGPEDALAAVKNARTYQIKDENAPSGKRDVAMDELSKGYEYGRTAVHISESDRNVTTYETTPGLDIMGFVEQEKYARYMDMSRANMIIAQRNNDKAAMGLSSLIHALYETESFAIARLVIKENKEPRILLLAYHIDDDLECLYDVELPFAEDLRQYKFPPLDRVVTVSGKELKVHRTLPNNELQEAMSDYVDRMDLMTFDQDEEGNPAEYATLDETYSPIIHHLNHAIKHRAIHPDAEPPPIHEILTRYSHPPGGLIKKAHPALQRVIEAAGVKKVPPQAKGRVGRRKDSPKPLSDLDVGALLAQDPTRKNKRINAKNAIPEFKQLLQTALEEDQIRDACKQLQRIIYDWIRHSVGDSGYQQAIEAIRTMREEVSDLEMPDLYNDFIRDMKSKLLAEELGGDRKEMWYRIRSSRLGLLLDKETKGGVVEEEARAFMSVR
ncbi:hypothetical protein M433DRAFT_72779 [Acidomyces richmondensis BFW]|nr:MAG: hypothetical protein FE78DRAFT_156218 [Acidomyces sp. 'richmondensis']KYG42937.1 hypothetical protein M433DRAFT_72779 [Acidomyces richmondensis BFW]